MTIGEKLHSLLTGSPSPTSAGAKVYEDEAPQGTQAPYLVYFMVSSNPIHSHDGTAELRNWHYQVSAFAADTRSSERLLNQVAAVLVDYTDRPADGIERCLESDRRVGGFVEPGRLFLRILELDIAERLP